MPRIFVAVAVWGTASQDATQMRKEGGEDSDVVGRSLSAFEPGSYAELHPPLFIPVRRPYAPSFTPAALSRACEEGVVEAPCRAALRQSLLRTTWRTAEWRWACVRRIADGRPLQNPSPCSIVHYRRLCKDRVLRYAPLAKTSPRHLRFLCRYTQCLCEFAEVSVPHSIRVKTSTTVSDLDNFSVDVGRQSAPCTPRFRYTGPANQPCPKLEQASPTPQALKRSLSYQCSKYSSFQDFQQSRSRTCPSPTYRIYASLHMSSLLTSGHAVIPFVWQRDFREADPSARPGLRRTRTRRQIITHQNMSDAWTSVRANFGQTSNSRPEIERECQLERRDCDQRRSTRLRAYRDDQRNASRTGKYRRGGNHVQAT
ncbi:hypothetical protein C8Q70DRAFT_698531 [Cubamyces menziesii]|nr:hypothetical protein C8Q70DRAFT_698531 [Cubamyces menziesii]